MKYKGIIAAALMAAGISMTAVSARTAKYVFYFIGDGMGLNPISVTEAYNRSVLGNDTPILMLNFPVVSYATSQSSSSDITDSAAGGTALATGHKTRNGMVGMDRDTVAVESVAAELYRKGWGIGLVTTGAPDDATPGAFYAHQPNRGMYFEIGREAARSGYQFIAGSNWRGLRDGNGKSTGLEQMFAENNVATVRGVDKLNGVTSERIVLLNTDTVRTSTVGYTVDSIPGVLNLVDMTKACLAHLQRTSPDRFFMMVENGDIDHASHSNDGGGVVHEVLRLQEAIQVAYDFYKQHPDETLIVITADHNTGGIVLGNHFLHYEANLKTLDYQRISKDRFSEWCVGMLKEKRKISWEEMEKTLTDKLGFWKEVKLTDAQTKRIKDEFVKTFIKRQIKDHRTLYNVSNRFVDTVFDTFNDIAGIGFTTESHSGDFVPVIALGVDADRFNGLHDNTNLPRIIYNIATDESLK